MEVLRKQTESGKVYRVYDNNPTWHIYEIERLHLYKFNDGEDFICWEPVVLPVKLYTNLDEAKAELDRLISLN